jgi:hypothetical protein
LTQAGWFTLLGTLVAVLSLLSTWQFRAQDKRDREHALEIAKRDAIIEKRDTECAALREANLNYRFALVKLSNTNDVVDRLLSPPVQPEGSGT